VPVKTAQDSGNLFVDPHAIHEENQHLKIAVAGNEKAKEALEFQKLSFEQTASSFETAARDICQAELAHNNAVLESDAYSVMNAQRAELGNATVIVTQFREHLTAAQQQASLEADQKTLVEKQATSDL